MHLLVEEQPFAQPFGDVDAAVLVGQAHAMSGRGIPRRYRGLLPRGVLAVRAGRVRGVPEHQRHIDVPGTQHAQRLGGFGLGQPQVNAGLVFAQHRCRGRDDGAERGRERRQPEPPGA